MILLEAAIMVVYVRNSTWSPPPSSEHDSSGAGIGLYWIYLNQALYFHTRKLYLLTGKWSTGLQLPPSVTCFPARAALFPHI